MRDALDELAQQERGLIFEVERVGTRERNYTVDDSAAGVPYVRSFRPAAEEWRSERFVDLGVVIEEDDELPSEGFLGGPCP